MPPLFPAPPVNANPYINGNRYDFTSMKFLLGGGVRFWEIQDVDYKNALTIGKVRGTSPYVRGRTRGIIDSDGSITFYRGEFQNFLLALLGTPGFAGKGFMEIPFGFSCSYGSTPADMITDTVVGARIKSHDHSHKEGGDALVVKAELDILQVLPGGLPALSGVPFGIPPYGG